MKRALLALFAAAVCSCNAPATGLFVVVDVSPRFQDMHDFQRLDLNVYSVVGDTTTRQSHREFNVLNFPLSFSVLPARLNGTYRIELKGLTGERVRLLPMRETYREEIFVVQRIVDMVEGEVRSISIPVRGHCFGSGVGRCNDVNRTCLVEVNSCVDARQATRLYTEAHNRTCPDRQYLDEDFECVALPSPTMMP